MTGRRDRGYTLVALIVGMTIMLVLIAAVLPLASTQIQREKEEELIFRGKQYAEGIRCFRRKYGRYPTTLKEMLQTKPRTLRKLWKDPITNSHDWGIVSLGTFTPVDGVPQPGPGGAPPGGGDFGGSFGGPKPTPAPTPRPGGGSGGGRDEDDKGGGMLGGGPLGGDAPLMPIMGVHSKSKKKAFRSFMGRDTYDLWHFTEQTLMFSGNEGTTTPGGLPGPGIGGGPMGGPKR